MRRRTTLALLSLVVLVVIATSGVAKPPWMSLMPFKRVEAEPGKSYELQEQHGPWLILAATFGGEAGERQAEELVLELRRRFKLPAYTHRQRYDYTDSVQGLTFDKYGDRKRMRYENRVRYDAIAVLVGDFDSIGNSKLEHTLDRIKHVRPDCLDITRPEGSSQHFAGLRNLYRKVSGDERKRNRGPMGSAFVTRNPLLPKEFFAPVGLDRFVLQLNRGVKFSLLDNPSPYTVRVATFRGQRTINQLKVQEIEQSGRLSDKLEIAADKANRLTRALRKRGEEAYEFHDRNESIVTIGGFETEGTPLPDGTVDINRAIHKIMKTYGAKPYQLPNGSMGLQPRQLDGITFDVQPYPIAVPRRSIARDYAR